MQEKTRKRKEKQVKFDRDGKVCRGIDIEVGDYSGAEGAETRGLSGVTARRAIIFKCLVFVGGGGGGGSLDLPRLSTGGAGCGDDTMPAEGDVREVLVEIDVYVKAESLSSSYACDNNGHRPILCGSDYRLE